MNKLLDFYAGGKPDDRGRFLRDIQEWPDERLESVHDFIQWMFPLLQPSGANPDAPVLDRETIMAFRSRPDLQANLETSFARMLRFYGLDLHPGPEVKIIRASNFAERSKNWLRPGNHNHLRITRILSSLRLLGREADARAFYDCLVDIYRDECATGRPRITEPTFEFWRAAANDPIPY
jgi:hypothetical protein